MAVPEMRSPDGRLFRRRVLAVLALLALSIPVSFGIYTALFGFGFAINRFYFPETMEYVDRFVPYIVGVTWVATFSTMSSIFMFVLMRKKARQNHV